MSTINQIQLPNGSTYDFEDTAAREVASSKADKTLATASANGLMSAADKKAVDREFFRMVPKGGTYIPANADLNSIEYIKVGNYYNTFDRESTTIKNIPVIQSPFKAFMMYVLSPLSEVYDIESTDQWVYRLRIFVTYTGNDIFTQQIYSENTPGRFKYGPWVKQTNSNDLGAVSKIINDHIAKKSNPHKVTKDQVGLGSVANLDQSKAIKSITRSGTTFTATALDGTTTTFTQQDGSTTYSVATSSADGLMSKEDKAKLDGLSDSGIHYVPFELVDGTSCSTTDSFNTVVSMLQANKPVQASVNVDGKVIALPVFMYDGGEIMFRNDEIYIIWADTLAIYGDTLSDKLQDNDTTETSGQAALDAHMGKVLSDRINSLKSDLVDTLYPVGSIYMSVIDKDPGTFIGGTWERIKDRFLLAAGDSYAAGSTGGKATHTHKYGIQFGAYWGSISMEADAESGVLQGGTGNPVGIPSGGVKLTDSLVNNGAETGTKTTPTLHYRSIADTSSASNMPPYLAVYVWKRTA